MPRSLLLWALLACQPPNPSHAEGVVTFTAHGKADLGGPLQEARRQAEEAGAHTLELILAPGDYNSTTIHITASLPNSPQTVRIRGLGPEPTELRHATMYIVARDVQLDNLAFSGAYSDDYSFIVDFTRSLDISRLRLGPTSVEERWHRCARFYFPFQESQEPRTLTIRDSRFVQNQLEEQAALMEVRCHGGHCLDEVTITRTAFIADRASALFKLDPGPLHIISSVVLEPELEAIRGRPHPDRQLHVEDSLIALRDAPYDPAALRALAAEAASSEMDLATLRARLLALPPAP